ncbi:MAG: putative hemolysin [Paracoccaceae bacterium]|jgi:putative hemolysin
MILENPHLILRLAADPRDLRAAQRLRYRVFVQELGANGPLVDHQAELEVDQFDSYFDHLLLIDTRRNTEKCDYAVGVYRLLPPENAAKLGRYYCEGEFDINVLKASGRRLLELGRSCVDTDYRGGSAMLQLWNGLTNYVLERNIDVLFGAASFFCSDLAALEQPLSYLYHNHLAPPELFARALDGARTEMNILSKEKIDRKAAMLATPALIKAYLRLGGYVGDGAYIDRRFNSVDVFLVLDTDLMSSKYRGYYTQKMGLGV